MSPAEAIINNAVLSVAVSIEYFFKKCVKTGKYVPAFACSGLPDSPAGRLQDFPLCTC